MASKDSREKKAIDTFAILFIVGAIGSSIIKPIANALRPQAETAIALHLIETQKICAPCHKVKKLKKDKIPRSFK